MPALKSYSISKTAFIKFEQCQKAFFLYKNHPYLRDKLTVDTQLNFKRGNDVGFFAQQLFPNGIDVSQKTKNALDAEQLTQQLIEQKTPIIYEATFIFNGVLVMVDILCLENDVYKAYEVKSSIKVSEVYLKDACLQYYVLKNCLQNLDDFFLVTLNENYVLSGEINPKQLFKKRSIKKQAEQNIQFFNDKINQAHLLLEENKIPNIAIGKHCFKPYLCDYYGTCWKNNNLENSIFNFPRIGKEKLFEWFDSGITEVNELSNAQLESEINIQIKTAFTKNVAVINIENITAFLNTILQPFTTMDMEIWSAAIPQLQQTKPYEQIPFLTCFFNGNEHTYFITEHLSDDRYNFALNLIEHSKNYKSILVYDKTMEVLAINKLADLFPDLKNDLQLIAAKIVDVYPIIGNFDYYHPEFKNNFSLKTVTEVLFPNINYSVIQSGLQAMAYFQNYKNSLDLIEKETLKQNLISYCQTDTLATFELVNFLKALN